MTHSSTTLSIKSSLLDRERELVIDKAFLTYDNKDQIAELPTKFLKQDIIAFRYGIKWIRGYQFVIGRIYCVDIQSWTGEIIKVRLKSFYGVNKKTLTEKYSTIVNSLYDIYFDDITRNYLQQYSDSIDFDILGINFRSDGVLMGKNSDLIPWEDLGTKFYTTYYAVFSKSNPTVYKAFEYLNDWNTGILYSVSRGILRSKNLYSE